MRMTTHMLTRVRRIISSPHLWAVVIMFVIGIVLHYPQQILSTSLPSLFGFLGLTRHALERIFFLLPISYAGFVFGIKAGLASLAIVLIIMLPRAIFISPSLPDALLETGGVIIIGGLVNLWFEGYRRERERRQQVLSKLEAAHQQLQSQVQVIRSNEKRLAGLSDVSAIVSHFFEFELDDLTRDAKVRDWLLEADSSIDPAKRKTLYSKALKRIAEQAYWCPLFTFVSNNCFTKDLDFTPYPDAVVRFFLAKWK